MQQRLFVNQFNVLKMGDGTRITSPHSNMQPQKYTKRRDYIHENEDLFLCIVNGSQFS